MVSDHITHSRGIVLVFMAGVLWSTVGLGVRMIDDAVAWQILFFRSISLSLFLSLVIYVMRRQNPIALARQMGWNGIIGGLALVGAYAGGDLFYSSDLSGKCPFAVCLGALHDCYSREDYLG